MIESGQESSEPNKSEFGSKSPDLWARALVRLRGSIDAQIFSAYVKPLTLASLETDTLGGAHFEVLLYAPSNFVRNHVEENYSAKIIEALESELCAPGDVPQLPSAKFTLRITVDPRISEAGAPGELVYRPRVSPYLVVKKVTTGFSAGAANSSVKNHSAGAKAGQFGSALNARYTFSSFIVGNSNQFCHAAAMRVAEQPGKSYNPLFIYGGVGLGKTHLLHAIGNAVLEKSPRARVLYLSSESFTNELIRGLRNSKMEEFKQYMRSIEVLLIDDIQFMCGKERTQEEFFHTFNTLYNSKHQIVITSDKIPQDIPGIEERLQTRFSWGLSADLQAPDFETRVAILKRKAAQDNFVLPENVAQFIAENISSNVRELEGALTRLHALVSLQQVPITIESTERALKPLLQPKSIAVSVTEIKKAVADHFGLKVSDIVSKRRTKNLSFPRHIAMYLCRKHTTSSYPEIGGHFGGRDHSSVIHAANVVSTKISTDGRVKDIISQLERRLFSI